MVDNKNYEDYYENFRMIGNSALGGIYKAKEKGTNNYRALKVINLEKIKGNIYCLENKDNFDEEYQKNINSFIREFENGQLMSKNNINSLKCYEYFYDENYFTIVMELCDNNLLQFMRQTTKDNEGFTIKEISEILRQLNNAFRIMKENKIIHRDLKLENILIKYNDKNRKKYIIKLADYGSSIQLNSLTLNTVEHLLIHPKNKYMMFERGGINQREIYIDMEIMVCVILIQEH